MKAWARLLAWAPATAVATVAGYLADWQTAAAAGSVSFLVARMVIALATRDATARFLAAVEGEANAAELALAARVGLDLETLKAAKVAVRAAVRAEMVRRGAGVAGLAASVALQAAREVQATSEAVDVVLGTSAAEAASPAAAPLSPAPASANPEATVVRLGRPDDVD